MKAISQGFHTKLWSIVGINKSDYIMLILSLKQYEKKNSDSALLFEMVESYISWTK